MCIVQTCNTYSYEVPRGRGDCMWKRHAKWQAERLDTIFPFAAAIDADVHSNDLIGRQNDDGTKSISEFINLGISNGGSISTQLHPNR